MIIKNANAKTHIFNDIPTGEVFRHNNSYYIKTWPIEDEDGEVWNAISLADGCYGAFSSNSEVITYPKAYLVIE